MYIVLESVILSVTNISEIFYIRDKANNFEKSSKLVSY